MTNVKILTEKDHANPITSADMRVEPITGLPYATEEEKLAGTVADQPIVPAHLNDCVDRQAIKRAEEADGVLIDGMPLDRVYLGSTEVTNVLGASQPTSSLAEALCKAQGVMGAAKKNKRNPHWKSTYADLASAFAAIREPFAENGLSITQTMRIVDNGRTVLRTKMMHVSGQYEKSEMLLPDIADHQKLTAAITYYRKNMLFAIAGLPAEEDDGETVAGRKAPKAATISGKQVAELETIVNGHTEVRALFLEQCNGDMANITVEQYPGAVTWVTNLIKEKGK